MAEQGASTRTPSKLPALPATWLAVPGLGRQVAERAPPGAADGLLELRPRGRRWRRPAPCPPSGRRGGAPCRRPRRRRPTSARPGRGRRPGRRPARRGPGSPARPRSKAGRWWTSASAVELGRAGRRGDGPRASARRPRSSSQSGLARPPPGRGPRAGGRVWKALSSSRYFVLGEPPPGRQRQVLAEPVGEEPPGVGRDRPAADPALQALGPRRPVRRVAEGDEPARVAADRPAQTRQTGWTVGASSSQASSSRASGRWR